MQRYGQPSNISRSDRFPSLITTLLCGLATSLIHGEVHQKKDLQIKVHVWAARNLISD